MQPTGPAGLYNVPVTKFLVLFVGTCSILAAIMNIKQYFYLQLIPHITIHHQFWRLLTSQIAFGSSGDVFFGSILLYTLRVIERQYGSSKYTVRLVMISTLLELGALVVGAQIGLKSIPGGPYALMFSALYQYYRIIPVTYRFRVFGIVMSDKLFLYVLALQVAFSQSFGTLTPAVCGILSGALYRTDIGNIKQWRFPAWIQKLTIRFVKPYLVSPPIARSASTTPSQRPIVTGIPPMESIMTAGLRNRRGTTATSASTRSDTASVSAAATDGPSSVREYLDTITGRDVAGSELEPPSPEHTRVLLAMFPDHPRETITRALSSAHNNLNRAVEIMLSTPAPNNEEPSSHSASTVIPPPPFTAGSSSSRGSRGHMA
ncbi:uba domain-containing protein ucp14 [Mucor ambiguus]|uniref:Uba domain-containing protein ucp14 n=1 Tax=Mucor ambiguus TaxID=91626 RepID=A0A0C9MEY0_9FUNG|nr:uba domain-containing protein ucp14 [Mucor ambiguus]